MKKLFFILAGMLLPAVVFAQSSESGARVSAGVDYKISKGWHLGVDEELRLGDGLGSLDRLQTTLGLSYKPVKYFKAAVNYSLINPYSSSKDAFKSARHRFVLSGTFYLDAGDFQFSLKEGLQLTKRTGTFNKYQTNPNALALKSKVTVRYRGWQSFKPFLSFEVRTQLNGPWGKTYGGQQTNASGVLYYPYEHTGYTHKYCDRYRFRLGGDVKLSKNHTLTPYLMYDICSEYKLDTNRKGVRLFSSGYEDINRFSVGLSYVFSF